MISNRAQVLFKETPPLVEAHFKCAADPFHEKDNLNGYINFGTAENFLIEEILLEKINKAPKLKAKELHYNFPWGSLELRNSYTEFLKEFLKVDKFEADNVAVSCGLSSVIEILSYAIFNEGEKVLTIAPLYNGFYHDFETRFKAEIVLSHSIDDNGEFDFDRLENDIKNCGCKTILINNPHNPLGHSYKEEEIRKIITIAKDLDIKIIADEVYANSVFGSNPFISFLDKRFDDLNYTDSIYHLYGLAKDFALSGFKVGFFASTDPKVTQAVQSLAYFHTVSTQTQSTATYLLSELDWCRDLFIKNNQMLLECFNTLSSGLEKMGIKYFPSNSGIFTMIDLSGYLKTASFESELELFRFLIDELRISITPGQFFGCDRPGYFRVCYAKPNHILLPFLERLERIKEF